MNPFNILFVISFLAFSFCTLRADAQVWTQKEDIPIQGRWSPYCFSLNDKIYVGGGYVGGGTSKHDLWEYDPATDAWTQKADVPGSASRTQAVAFVVGNKGYVGLGSENYNTFNSTFLSDLWEYDPTTDEWTQKTSLPDSARHGVAVFVAGAKAYVVGGYTDYPTAAKSNDTWEYDPSNDQWTSRQSYPLPYNYDAQAFAIGTNGYVTGGSTKFTGFTSDRTTKATYRYNATNDSWTSRADYPWNGRDNGVAFVLNGKAYVGLGQSQDSMFYYYVEFAQYDDGLDAWTAVDNFPVVGGDRAYSVAGVANGKAYVGGGFAYISSEHYFDDWYQFDPTFLTVGSVSAEQVIKCYPNPFAENLHVDIKHSSHQAVYTLYTLEGKMITRSILSSDGNIPVDRLTTGVYVLEVQTDESIHRVRLVHQTK